MTSGNVNNFVSDLVLMAKAMEELPQVKQELAAAQDQEQILLERIQNNEMRINNLKHDLEVAAETRRKLEAERDDAELRFLECEDRTRSALDFIKTTFGSAGSLIQALEPPAPMPVAAPPAEPEVKHEDMKAVGEEIAFNYPQGQSEPGPTASTVALQESAQQSPTAEPVLVEIKDNASSGEVPKSDANPPVTGQTSAFTDLEPVEKSETVSQAPTSTADNVGYHNEPNPGSDWQAWDDWANRMDVRYGKGHWPNRTATF